MPSLSQIQILEIHTLIKQELAKYDYFDARRRRIEDGFDFILRDLDEAVSTITILEHEQLNDTLDLAGLERLKDENERLENENEILRSKCRELQSLLDESNRHP